MSENKELKINVENLNAAYAMADENTKKVLDALFGRGENGATASRPVPTLSDYTTIRSYEDACMALGVEPIDENKLLAADCPKHLIAEMKLELVCKALWGGENKCQPTGKGGVYYYYPWFALYTENEVKSMNDEQRGALLSAYAGRGANAGFGCLGAYYRSSYSAAPGGFRLCLDTEEKAEYFGNQFVELWAEYLAYNFTVGEHLK